jgi:vitamin B12 transporter
VAFTGRSDDSTFLGGRDLVEGNSLLLPNRNLDFGYSKLDLGGSYQLLSWVGAYAQLDNLTSNKRIAPIGFPSLPSPSSKASRVDRKASLSRGRCCEA